MANRKNNTSHLNSSQSSDKGKFTVSKYDEGKMTLSKYDNLT